MATLAQIGHRTSHEASHKCDGAPEPRRFGCARCGLTTAAIAVLRRRGPGGVPYPAPTVPDPAVDCVCPEGPVWAYLRRTSAARVLAMDAALEYWRRGGKGAYVPVWNGDAMDWDVMRLAEWRRWLIANWIRLTVDASEPVRNLACGAA